MRIPSYRRHKASGQAIVTLSGHDHYLGSYDSPESREKYERLIAEWLAAGKSPIVKPTLGTTVSEVLAAYLTHAERRYEGGTWHRIKGACKTAIALYGNVAVKEFRGRALKAVQARMIAEGRLNRKNINARVGCLKRAFRWALAEELIPAEAYQSLVAVMSIRKGDVMDLPESRDVLPVSLDVVEATLSHLPGYLPDVVRLQLAAGMRPGEALAVRADEIHQLQPDLWLWKPASHKTAHRGHVRQVYFGPAAIAIVRDYLERAEGGYLFSPRRAREERFQKMRAERKTPVQPSQLDRSKNRPKKVPGERYRVSSYNHAVRKAAKKAGVEHWHPHQLRHTAGTLVAHRYGHEAARIFLGHRTLDATQIYVAEDLKQIQEIVKQMG